jgi:hypothetical protein
VARFGWNIFIKRSSIWFGESGSGLEARTSSFRVRAGGGRGSWGIPSRMARFPSQRAQYMSLELRIFVTGTELAKRGLGRESSNPGGIPRYLVSLRVGVRLPLPPHDSNWFGI